MKSTKLHMMISKTNRERERERERERFKDKLVYTLLTFCGMHLQMDKSKRVINHA